MREFIVWKDGDLTKVTLDRSTEAKSDRELIEMLLNPKKRFKTLMGTTDDTLAIQYAIDLGARKVKLGKGVYYIDKPIKLGHGANIVGRRKRKRMDSCMGLVTNPCLFRKEVSFRQRIW